MAIQMRAWLAIVAIELKTVDFWVRNRRFAAHLGGIVAIGTEYGGWVARNRGFRKICVLPDLGIDSFGLGRDPRKSSKSSNLRAKCVPGTSGMAPRATLTPVLNTRSRHSSGELTCEPAPGDGDKVASGL